MQAFALLILFLMLFTNINSAIVVQNTYSNFYEENQIKFMQQYGYLPKPGEGEEFAFTPDSMIEAVKSMQAFGGLPQTGVIDDQTKSLFTKKRCGLEDIGTNEEHNNSIRKKRYVLTKKPDGIGLARWNKKLLTFKVENAPRSLLDKDEVETLMKKSLDIWAPHGNLEFSNIQEGQADIVVTFASGDHRDNVCNVSFDGPGEVVAHAFRPPIGVIHFDDDEIWTDSSSKSENGTNFFAVAIHEIGHALGLEHSKEPGSVMGPYYDEDMKELHEDDIAGMHELYSIDETPTSLISSNKPRRHDPEEYEDAIYEEEDKPDLCYANYDTIAVLQGKIFVFQEEWLWVFLDRNKIEKGYPKKLHDVFKGLPKSITSINTIYEKRNGNIVIFSGKKYFEFNPTFRFRKVGRLADYSLPRRVRELSTVFVSNVNNKTYLISDEKFWRYDEESGRIDRKYPKKMSAWRNVPYPIDAAIIWEGDTYFFCGPRYWRFDNATIKAHENYPLPTALIWFNCPPKQDMEKFLSNE